MCPHQPLRNGDHTKLIIARSTNGVNGRSAGAAAWHCCRNYCWLLPRPRTVHMLLARVTSYSHATSPSTPNLLQSRPRLQHACPGAPHGTHTSPTHARGPEQSASVLQALIPSFFPIRWSRFRFSRSLAGDGLVLGRPPAAGGCWVVVVASEGTFLGSATQTNSSLAVRPLSHFLPVRFGGVVQGCG